jgi:hypothetical protein
MPEMQGSSADSGGMHLEALHRKRSRALVRLQNRLAGPTHGSVSEPVRADISEDYTRRLHGSGRTLPIKAGGASLPHFGLTGEIDNAPSTAAIISRRSEDQP